MLLSPPERPRRKRSELLHATAEEAAIINDLPRPERDDRDRFGMVTGAKTLVYE
jgi:hypothetical protein